MQYPYNHLKIIGALKHERKFSSLLMKLMMGRVLKSDKKTVGFDSVAEDLRIAPLMQPLGEGGVLDKRGYETTTLTPAYTKPKLPITYEELIARKPGQQINGQDSTARRYAEVLKENAQILDGRIERLKAYMLAQLINLGKVSITSPLYGNYLIDFQRPSANTKILTGGARWGETGVKPMEDVEDFVQLMNRPIRAIVFGKKAWRLYAKDEDRRTWSMNVNLARLGKTDKLAVDPIQFEEKLWRKVGHQDLLGVDLYVDMSYVHDEAGNRVQLLDDYGIQFIPRASLGVMGYGAIQDPKAKFKAYEIFYKTYELDDPAIPFVQAQSAPVPFHTDMASTGYMRVR